MGAAALPRSHTPGSPRDPRGALTEAPPLCGCGTGLEQGPACARGGRDGLTLRTSFVCALLCRIVQFVTSEACDF